MQDALRSRRLLGATAIGLLLTIAATLSVVSYRMYESEMEEWREQLDHTSLLLAAQVANEMAVADLLLDGMLERIAALKIDDADALRRHMSSKAAFQELLARKKALAQIDVASVTDDRGRLLAFTRTYPAPPITLADRDYFLAQRDRPGGGAFISGPVRNRGNGEWTFYLSRRISAADGRFLGVALVGISSRRLGAFFSQVGFGAGASLSLCRRDAVVLARSPRLEEAAPGADCRIGMRDVLARGTLRHGVAVVMPSGANGAASTPARLVAVRLLDDFPLVIAASAPRPLYLRQWRTFALQLATVGLLCGLSVLAGFALLRREMRRRDQAMLRQRALQAEADAANRAKSDFLAMISHEIRTPLTSVIGFAEQLPHARGARESAELGAIIARNGQTLLALINDILDMSKMESGKLVLEHVPFAPRDALASVYSLLSGQAQERGLAFEVDVGPDCPHTVMGDPTRWRQILMNLVSNAIKFTEHGGVSVRVWYEAGAQLLHCRVEDTGIGMEPEQLARLFAPFEQADGSIARRFGGTGLGLFLVGQLVDAMHGTVAIDTAPGAGTRVTATVRAVVVAMAPDPESDGGRTGGPLAGRVLLVEDGEDNRRLIAALLRGRGLDVLCAADGEQGAAVALRERPDLVLMDIRMPVLDGVAAMRRLRAAGFAAPVVALTANVMAQDQERYRREGFAACLAKPVERAAFDRMLGVHLRAAARRAPTGFSDLPEFADLRAAFVKGLAPRLAQMRAALERGDLASLRQASHTLKGTAPSFGCPRIGAAAAQVERNSLVGDRTGSSSAMADLEAAALAEAPAAHGPQADSGGCAGPVVG